MSFASSAIQVSREQEQQTRNNQEGELDLAGELPFRDYICNVEPKNARQYKDPALRLSPPGYQDPCREKYRYEQDQNHLPGLEVDDISYISFTDEEHKK